MKSHCELLRAWRAIVCHVDGHVDKLLFHPIEAKSCSIVKFVKPTEKSKIQDG